LLPILIYFILIEINKVPFDFQEAESELIMGYTNEYVGFLFGVYVLIEYLHIFIYSYLFFVLIM
jgi:NADH:ubiquinone oxidoreductase subunit H